MDEHCRGDVTGCGTVSDRSGSAADQLAAALAGDRDQWRCLVEEFSPLLASVVAGYRLGDEGADVIQFTFLKLFEHGARIRDPRALPGWLITTVRHEALRVLRRRSRMATLTREIESHRAGEEMESPDDRVLRMEEYAILHDLLDRLPARQRVLLSLLSQSDRPDYRRVGELVGIPTGSIGPTRRRGLNRLRHEWQARDGSACA